jgi:hypothetical protein
MEYKEAVYPKENPEYRQQVLNELYKKVRNTNWDIKGDDEYQGKPRGRKPKPKQGPPPEYYKPKRKNYVEPENYISLDERVNLRKKN